MKRHGKPIEKKRRPRPLPDVEVILARPRRLPPEPPKPKEPKWTPS